MATPPKIRLFEVVSVTALAAAALSIALSASGSGDRPAARMEGDAMEEIKRVIEESYVEGLHERQDEAAVRAGFHQHFRMYVSADGDVVPVSVEEWLARVAELRANDQQLWRQPTRVDFETVDVSGDCAAAKLTVHKGARYFSTDYMLLYRLDEGWRIVAKVFTTQRPRE